MKTYTDLDIISKAAGINTTGILTRDILYYVSTTNSYTFVVPPKDYIELVRATIMDRMFVNGGRTKDDMPFFSIAGITFTMITQEQADKYILFK